MRIRTYSISALGVILGLALVLSPAAAQEVIQDINENLEFRDIEGMQEFEEIEDEPLTQEEFAVELVRLLAIEDLLPPAALPSDAVNLLERLGIAPLKGWDNKAYLTQEDYLVIIGKAQGREGVVHERAVGVEERNIQIINEKWQQARDDLGSWPPLDELLNDPRYFPGGVPQSPYGFTYRDVNGNHTVDPVFLPAPALVELREAFSAE